jgi:hypothetical protein
MLRIIFLTALLYSCGASSLFAAWSQPPVNISDLHVIRTFDLGEVSMDSANGNAVAIWQNNVTSETQTAIKPFNQPWLPPMNLSIPGNGSSSPDIAMSSNGNAVAVWRDQSLGVIQSSYYTASTKSWSAPVTISSPPVGQRSQAANVCIDALGNGAAMWQDSGGKIQARRFVNGVWTAQTITLANKGSMLIAPLGFEQIASDSHGNIVAIFTGSTGPNFQIKYATYTVSTNTWAFSSFVTPSTVNAQSYAVAVNSSGNAVLFWVLQPVGQNQIAQAATLDFVLGAWGPLSTVQTISTSSESPNPGNVAIDGFGNAVAVWYDLNHFTITAASYTRVTQTWTEQLISDTTSNNVGPCVCVDTTGDAIIVWKNNTLLAVQSVTRPASISSPSTWSQPQILSSIGQGFFNDPPRVANDSHGFATAIWGNQTLGSVQSSSWTPNAPRRFHGRLYRKQHLKKHKKYRLFTRWSSPEEAQVSEYNLYEDGKLKHTFPATKQTFKKHTISSRHLRKRYAITAVNASGGESNQNRLKIKHRP